MESKHILLAIMSALVVGALLLYATYDPEPGGKNLTPDQERGYTLLRTAQTACLISRENSASIGLEALIEAGSAKAGATANKSDLIGAVGYASEQIRGIQDSEIRACMDKRWPAIEACLLDNCAAAQVSDIEARFSFNLEARDTTTLDPNLLAFGRQYRDFPQILRQTPPQNYYLYNVGLPVVGKPIRTFIHRVVRDSFIKEQSRATNLCLERADTLDFTLPTYTHFQCDEASSSCSHDPASPKWLNQCAIVENPNNASLAVRTALAILSSPANALEKDVWLVPSLETIRARSDLEGQGYTIFHIASEKPIAPEADGYFVALSINGQPIHIDGLPPSFSIQPFSEAGLIDYRFALQNLNFSGLDAGCDTIEATIQFVKDGELFGDMIQFQRSYVALRDAREKTLKTDGNRLTWAGKYVRAPKQYDNEVFINGISNGSDPSDVTKTGEHAKMARILNTWKQQFDGLDLTFDGVPVVAVSRPPLTRFSYGVVAGIVQPSGQIQFTFKYPEAKRLSTLLQAARAEGGRRARVIDHREYIYAVRGEDHQVSPPVCRDDLDMDLIA